MLALKFNFASLVGETFRFPKSEELNVNIIFNGWVGGSKLISYELLREAAERLDVNADLEFLLLLGASHQKENRDEICELHDCVELRLSTGEDIRFQVLFYDRNSGVDTEDFRFVTYAM